MPKRRGGKININMAKNTKLIPILSIIVGILVVAVPAILAWAVGLYLVITGILDLTNK